MNDFFDNLLDKIKSGIEFELVEIINTDGSTPRTKGSFMAIDKEGNQVGTIGGGEMEYLAYTDAKIFLGNKENSQKKYVLNNSIKTANSLEMVCGGSADVKFTYIHNSDENIEYLEKLSNTYRDLSKYYIFGAGQVSEQLSKILLYLKCDVTVYDDRENFANHDRYDKNIKIYAKPYTEITNTLKITNDDFVVVMTNEHTNDYKVVSQILKNYNPYYIGCIGSVRKSEIMKNMLKKDGFDLSVINSIHAPIGIPIAAETVEEIAISISAELILYKAKKENRRKIVENKSILGKLKEYV